MSNQSAMQSDTSKPFDSSILLQLANEKTAGNRTELVKNVSDLFIEKGETLSDRERFLMFDILHKVVAEVEMSLRHTISKQLSVEHDAPNELIKLLANDDIEVAYPILSNSTVLCDADLLEIIRHRTKEHQLAVSIRENVSCEISTALVETDNEQVICSLLDNKNSNISKKTMEYLVEKSERTDSFQEPILHREELEPEMVKQMFFWVSSSLRHYIIENVDIGKTDIDEIIDQATQKGIMDIAEANEHKSKSDVLAETLKREGIATPKILLKTLKEGEIQLFLAMFAQLTDLPTTLITQIVFESDGKGLAISCKAIGITKDNFKTIFTLSQQGKPDAEVNLNLALTRLLEFYDKFTTEAAKRIILKWKRSSDNQISISNIELGGDSNVKH